MPMLRYNKRGPKYWIHRIRQEQLRRTLEHVKAKDLENGEQMLTFFIDAECAKNAKVTYKHTTDV